MRSPRNRVLLLMLATLFTSSLFAQTKTYLSGSGEIIFSFARINAAGNDLNPNLRFSPVFNGQAFVNHNFGNSFGIFYGLAYRNVGFIYEPAKDTLKKHRTYNFGIPVGFKVGNMSGTFLFFGYELEIPYSYKEKTFIDEEKKSVETEWFSPKVNPVVQSVYAGINFKGGASLKFKYYIDPFFNSNYTETVAGVQVKPYSSLKVNVFYVALCFNMFKDVKDTNKYRKHKNKIEPTTSL